MIIYQSCVFDTKHRSFRLFNYLLVFLLSALWFWPSCQLIGTIWTDSIEMSKTGEDFVIELWSVVFWPIASFVMHNWIVVLAFHIILIGFAFDFVLICFYGICAVVSFFAISLPHIVFLIYIGLSLCIYLAILFDLNSVVRLEFVY